MQPQLQQTMHEFFDYPSVGADDWGYAYPTALVRALETQMLTSATLSEMANAPDLPSAVAALAGSDYAVGGTGGDFDAILRDRRRSVRELFEQLVPNEMAALFRSRDDFANLRMAVRRAVLDRPIGTDYSADGNVAPDLFEQVFQSEDYTLLPAPLPEVTEQAVLGYYQNKDIRQIDHAIDAGQARYELRMAEQLDSAFLWSLFHVQVDLTNIRTMLRQKLMEVDQRDVFLGGGFVDRERFWVGLDAGYDVLGGLFMATPYQHILEAGAAYVAANQSFLKVEQLCDQYLLGFLESTSQITAGLQPVVAYLLMVEHEIRTVRLILTAKKNRLDTKLILDRVA